MNSISISGNIAREAETKFLSSGDAVTSFALADNQAKDKPAIFWNCSLFGKRGEALAQYLAKGQPVTVIGNITEREYTDKEGIKRKAQDVRVNDVILMGGKREGAAPQGKPQQQQRSKPAQDDFAGEDIPF